MKWQEILAGNGGNTTRLRKKQSVIAHTSTLGFSKHTLQILQTILIFNATVPKRHSIQLAFRNIEEMEDSSKHLLPVKITTLFILGKNKICTVCLKCITKKYTTLKENMQLKVKSPGYFLGLLNASLYVSEIYTKNVSD